MVWASAVVNNFKSAESDAKFGIDKAALQLITCQ